MNAAHGPALRPERFAVPFLVVAATAGVVAGWFSAPGAATASDYVYALVHPACVGAMCFVGGRGVSRAARWMPMLLLAIFVLDIVMNPHVMVLSALGLGAGAIAVYAALRGRQRWAAANVVVCSALLAATLVGGLSLR